MSGSTESGRAYADPHAAPLAIAYYRALARAGQVVYRVSPYARGQGPVAFDFDWSFDYYPLAYARPGPSMVVYRLHGGRCARHRCTPVDGGRAAQLGDAAGRPQPGGLSWSTERKALRP